MHKMSLKKFPASNSNIPLPAYSSKIFSTSIVMQLPNQHYSLNVEPRKQKPMGIKHNQISAFVGSFTIFYSFAAVLPFSLHSVIGLSL